MELHLDPPERYVYFESVEENVGFKAFQGPTKAFLYNPNNLSIIMIILCSEQLSKLWPLDEPVFPCVALVYGGTVATIEEITTSGLEYLLE